MIEVGGRPARYQPGDLVEAELTSGDQGRSGELYAKGTVVTGVVMRWVNYDARLLDEGRVEIRLKNHDVLWVTATKVLRTRAEREHPFGAIEPAYRWHCGCGESGFALTEDAARAAHTGHGEKAPR